MRAFSGDEASVHYSCMPGVTQGAKPASRDTKPSTCMKRHADPHSICTPEPTPKDKAAGPSRVPTLHYLASVPLFVRSHTKTPEAVVKTSTVSMPRLALMFGHSQRAQRRRNGHIKAKAHQLRLSIP